MNELFLSILLAVSVICPVPVNGRTLISEDAASRPLWLPVASFSGSDYKTTAPFTISSKEWRVRWSLTGSAQARKFGIEDLATLTAGAYPDDVSKNKNQHIVLKVGSGSGSTKMYGKGIWRIKVTSANSDWTLSVEEYR